MSSLALLSGLLSCQTATQITVKLRGVGIACPGGESPIIQETGVLAKQQLNAAADIPELGVVGDQCSAAEASVVSLGDIVLVPSDGPGPVEVLALGALKVGAQPAASAEDCRGEYERLFGAPCEIGEGKACESCIFARRSVAFVKHSKLELTIDLEAACAGVICDLSQTCSQGSCVSSETSCEGDGPCVLVAENQGGSGAGGSGGAGVVTGGSGGGNGEIWEPLWEAGESANCLAAHPHDVVGTTLAGEQVTALFVAAGSCVLELKSGQDPQAYPGPAVGSVQYRAVAAAPDDVVTLGDFGYALYSANDDFTSLVVLPELDKTELAIGWDVALTTNSALAWTRSTQSAGVILPWVPQPAPVVQRAAVFSVFPAAGQGGVGPVTFGAYGTNLRSTRDGVTAGTELGLLNPPGWSLWATELFSANPQVVRVGVLAVSGDTDRVYFALCTTSPTGGCAFDVPGFPALESSISRKVIAIWGINGKPTAGELTLYAIGEEGNAPWLARTSLQADGTSTQLDWLDADLPRAIVDDGEGALDSIWVGPTDDGGEDWVVLAGSEGVFRGRVDALF